MSKVQGPERRARITKLQWVWCAPSAVGRRGGQGRSRRALCAATELYSQVREEILRGVTQESGTIKYAFLETLHC